MSGFGWRKKCAWIALAFSAGGTLAFGLLCCVYRYLPPFDDTAFYLYPLTTATGAFFSLILLRRFYRLEPAKFSGSWHLAVSDLVAIVFFAATCMAVWSANWPRSFIDAGVGVAMELSVGFAFCLMLCARLGFASQRVRISRAFSLYLKSLGWVATGTFAVPVVLFLRMGNPGTLEEWASHVFSTTLDWSYDWWGAGFWTAVAVALRIAVVCVPMGYAFGWLSNFLASRENQSRYDSA